MSHCFTSYHYFTRKAEASKKMRFLEGALDNQRRDLHAERDQIKTVMEKKLMAVEAALEEMQEQHEEDVETQRQTLQDLLDEQTSITEHLESATQVQTTELAAVQAELAQVRSEAVSNAALVDATREGKDTAVAKWRDRANEQRDALQAALEEKGRLETQLEAR
jgi:hypothetical protein